MNQQSKEQLFNQLSNKLNINLPKISKPFFMNHTFKSEADMAAKIKVMNDVFNNEKNEPTVASLNQFFNAKISFNPCRANLEISIVSLLAFKRPIFNAFRYCGISLKGFVRMKMVII